MPTKPDAETLHRLNLKGYGPGRLSKLTDEILKELCELYAIDPVPDLKAERISALLKARQKSSPLASPGQTDEDDEVEDGDVALSSGVFRQNRHSVKLLAFNSLKLRLGRESLQTQWLALVGEMTDVDVVLMSEVPASDARAKTEALVGLIQHASESSAQWTFSISEPSGPGNPEVHVCLCKLPLKIVGSQTITHAGGTKLDHAPLVVKLLDTRFSKPQTLVFASVHFPPASRANARDEQIKTFFSSYAQEAAMRLDEPFTAKGARDARKDPVIHIAAGDFNAYPGAVVDLESIGWGQPLVGSNVATSAGRKSFDHFVPSGWTSSAFNLRWDVLELVAPQNSRLGKIGLSDHDPIVLEIKEVRTTTDSAAKYLSNSTVSSLPPARPCPVPKTE